MSNDVLNVKIGPTSKRVWKNWENKCSKHSKVFGVYFGYMGAKLPEWIDPKFFGRRYQWHNHVFQNCWESVKGFSVG